MTRSLGKLGSLNSGVGLNEVGFDLDGFSSGIVIGVFLSLLAGVTSLWLSLARFLETGVLVEGGNISLPNDERGVVTAWGHSV